MAGTKLDNWAYLDSDWEDEIQSKNILKKGWYNTEFTNFSATTESEIAAGSSIDIDGVMYVFGSQESIGGTETASSINYIRVYDSSSTALAEYTTTAPAWDEDKKGWYSGVYRYILQFYYTGSIYQGKKILSDNRFEYEGETSAISADYTIPDVIDARVFLVTTTDTEKVTITLPSAAGCPGRIFKILKASDTYAPVVIDTYSTETINGWSYVIDSVTYQLVPIFFKNECCEVVSDGGNWQVINGYKPIYDTGLIHIAGSYSANNLGWCRITMTSVTGSFELFEVIEGQSSGKIAIVAMIDSGNNYLYLLEVTLFNISTGVSGPFDTESLVGGSSAANGTFSAYTADSLLILYPFSFNGMYEIDTNKKLTIPPKMDLFCTNSWHSDILDYSWFQKMGVDSSEASFTDTGATLVTINDDNTYTSIRLDMAEDGLSIIRTDSDVVTFFRPMQAQSSWYRLILRY